VLMRQYVQMFAVGAPFLLLGLALLYPPVLWAMVIVLSVIVLGVYDLVQKKHTVRRLYPFLGRFRYWLESVRPEIQQYFVETELDGKPAAREFRSLIYQRAKGEKDTRPFGTIFDVNKDGYEWMNHSLVPKHPINTDPRIKFGGDCCSQPYMASPLNISAMSYESLSGNATLALNKGAKSGGFSHNSGRVPDFITVDGGEGCTGATPTEMTNSVGTPRRDALIFVNQTLIGIGLRDQIRIIASGKIFSAFHLLRVLALGAVHRSTVVNPVELLAAAGLDSLYDLEPRHINHRVQGTTVKTYAQLYPGIDSGCLLDNNTMPNNW